MALPLAQTRGRTGNSVGVWDPGVPARPGFYCRLSDQPDHLVAGNSLRCHLSAECYDRGLCVSPECEFTSGDQFARALGDKPGLANAFVLRADEPLAIVRDPGTGGRWPYWLEADLAATLARLGERAVPYLSSVQKRALALAGILTTADTLSAQRELWSRKVEACVAQFVRRGFAPIAGLIHPFHISALRRYYRRLVRCGWVQLGDSQSPRRYVLHNDVVASYFHHQLAPAISRLAGERVKPSYVYCAAYQEGAELPQHLDRAQCEFSVTLCLDYAPEPSLHTPWPIRLHTPQGTTSVFQAIGDGLLYRGCRLPHSRGRLPSGQTSTSIFFHYVAEDFAGPLR